VGVFSSYSGAFTLHIGNQRRTQFLLSIKNNLLSDVIKNIVEFITLISVLYLPI
jgi:hypothetical protein